MPKGKKEVKGQAYKRLIDSLHMEIYHYQARKLPDEVYFYNEHVVEYSNYKLGEDYQDSKHRTSLSERKPRITTGLSITNRAIRDAIIGAPIEEVEQTLGISPGCGSTTPTPPTSADRRGQSHRPTGSTKAAQAQPPLQTRARAAGPIPGLEPE
ncbi:hypothetical protein K466DRAFT_665764 [Polyporus arcularius HHB13444]|uniref:Uncharacterized protein n=1 Tax=Polyporus arcularius HHB13444 TaxID=1314778 RepID=A0A5C3P3G9_9APHY|nr:hypothetical protein K466DRAFT_665764 [Polyporus arcularius HHB13444]